MRRTFQISIVILLSANFFFIRCHDRNERITDNDSLRIKGFNHIKYTDDTTLVNEGKSLFVKNCGSCHKVWATDSYLAGIVDRVGEDYLKLYVTKQDSLIKAKNKHALEVKKMFGNLANVHNFKFSNEQFNAIIAYLKKYSP
jgi:mono/diheme cytochrome c family protein